jgi:hypothetical protein
MVEEKVIMETLSNVKLSFENELGELILVVKSGQCAIKVIVTDLVLPLLQKEQINGLDTSCEGGKRLKANSWGGMDKYNESAELLLDLLYGAMESEGYEVKEFGGLPMFTSTYGGIQAKIGDEVFDITVKPVMNSSKK